MMTPVADLNEHLPYMMPVESPEVLREAIEVLLGIGTCFAVITTELEIRTTGRGATALTEFMEGRRA